MDLKLESLKHPAWQTSEGFHLIQLHAESTHYRTSWAEAELLDEAFSYNLVDPANQEILKSFRGSEVKEKNYSFNSDTTITRFIVEQKKLLKCVFHYHEESTYDLPIVSNSTPEVVYSNLTPVDSEEI